MTIYRCAVKFMLSSVKFSVDGVCEKLLKSVDFWQKGQVLCAKLLGTWQAKLLGMHRVPSSWACMPPQL